MSIYQILETGYCIAGTSVDLLRLRMRAPIFIIGTGRCGTSLLVEILGSHRQLVTFPGEANSLWHPKSYPYHKRRVATPPILQDAGEFSRISIGNWPSWQKKRIQNTLNGFHFIRGASKTFIVKSAMISFMIPTILSIFPNAKFLHIYRSGPPVIESLVVKEWEKYSDHFSARTEFRNTCAKYWNDCILEIEKQRIQLGLDRQGALLELSYEQLCENPPKALNMIGKFLEVPPTEFSFDLTTISSRNFKAGDYEHDETWLEALKIMAPGLMLKGYYAGSACGGDMRRPGENQ